MLALMKKSNRLKRFAALVLAIGVLTAPGVLSEAAHAPTALVQPQLQQLSQQTDEVRVMVDGRIIEFDVPPQIMNGRTMVPLRFISEALGAQLRWDDANQIIDITHGNTEIQLQIGTNRMTVNGQVSTMDQAPVVISGRTLIPLRYVAEAFGASVSWDGPNRTAIINSREHQQGQQPGQNPNQPGQQPGRIWSPGDAIPQNAPWQQQRYAENPRGSIVPIPQALARLEAVNNRAFNLNNPAAVWTGQGGFSHPPLTENDLRLKRDHIDAMRYLWDNSAVGRSTSFNGNYLADILEGCDIYFANERLGGFYEGLFSHSPGDRNPQIFIRAHEQRNQQFGVSTQIHETMRALGYGSQLVTMVRGEFDMHEYANEKNRVLFLGDFEYDSTFMRILSNAAGMGRVLDAGATSEQALGALWDQHLRQLIPYEDLMVAVSVGIRLQGRDPALSLATLYQNSANSVPISSFGVELVKISDAFLCDNNRQRNPDISFITNLAQFGRQHGIAPHVSVADVGIQNTPVAIARREAEMGTRLGTNSNGLEGEAQNVVGTAQWDQDQYRNPNVQPLGVLTQKPDEYLADGHIFVCPAS